MIEHSFLSRARSIEALKKHCFRHVYTRAVELRQEVFKITNRNFSQENLDESLQGKPVFIE